MTDLWTTAPHEREGEPPRPPAQLPEPAPLPRPIEPPRPRPQSIIAIAALVMTVVLGLGWLWHRAELTSLRAELGAQAADFQVLDADIDDAYVYLDGIAMRQQSVERIVRRSPDFAAVEDLLEDAVVQIHTEFGQGSGFRLDFAAECYKGAECLVYQNEGYDTLIVTNYHVISDVVGMTYEDRVVTVVGPDGSQTEGRVWDWDTDHDLAIVDLDRSDLDRHVAALLWAPPESVEVGDPVAIGGYPFGLDFITAAGVVTGQQPGLWQTDAIINVGSSGSPLVDAFGRVIGVAGASGGGITDAVAIDALCEQLLDC